MRPLMASSGHAFFAPDVYRPWRALAPRDAAVDLDTHIEDLLHVLFYEDLRDVVLIGIAMGIVATGCGPGAGSDLAIDLSGCVRSENGRVSPISCRRANERTRAAVPRATAGECAESDPGDTAGRSRVDFGAARAAAAEVFRAAARVCARRSALASSYIARRLRRTVRSHHLASERSASRDGAITRSVPPTARTSPHPMNSWRY